MSSSSSAAEKPADTEKATTIKPKQPLSLFGAIRSINRSRRPADRIAFADIWWRVQVLLKKRRELPDLRSFMREAEHLILRRDLDDTKTLASLRLLYLSEIKKASSHDSKPKDDKASTETADAAAVSGRALSRVRDIKVVLDDLRTEHDGGKSDTAASSIKYLDDGCSEGRITKSVVDYLHIDPKNAFGVDVVDQEADPSFTFKKTDGETLDFPDNTFDLETMFMSGHHFQKPDKVFLEARRVAKKGATLIMREHDAEQKPYLQLFFDLAHALYSVVFNNEETPEEFAAKYAAGTYAYYRNVDDWAAIAAKAGWKFVRSMAPDTGKKQGDSMNSVYLVFTAE